MHRVLPILIASTLICSLNLQGQSNYPDIVQAEAYLSVDKIRPGDAFKVVVEAKIQDDWHVNSHQPSEEFLIPTVVKFDTLPGLETVAIRYPRGEMKRFQFSENPLSVYEGAVAFRAELQAADDLELGELRITGQLTYQACNDVSCLAPAKAPFDIVATVVAPGTPVQPINSESFSKSDQELGELEGVRDSPSNKIDQLIAGKGFALTLFFVFLGGLALNLTPCVYPLIPITISYFVGQASDRLSKSFLLALVYVLGMAVTYSVLGVVAATTGGLLGASLQSPVVVIAIAAIFLIFAAGMFGAFEIRVPTFLANFAGGSRQGVFGSLFMGLTVGIVAAPCIGPFVLSLLTYVAAQGQPYIGFIMFFILSLGLGLPFLVLGTFSGLVKNLPRSGEWMNWIKRVFGVVMIGVAVYFISTLIPQVLYVVLLTGVAIVGGILVGFIDRSAASFGWFKGLKRSVGVLMIVFGLWNSVSAWQAANRPHVNWQPYSDTLITDSSKPVIIDFFAEWCLPCKQIEKTLFSEPSVVALSEEFVALKADLTQGDSQQVQNLRRKYQVHGVPTIILLDRHGKEYRRFTDELLNFSAEEFVEIMKGVLPRS